MAALDLVGPYLTKIAIDRYITQGDAPGLARVAALYMLTLLAAFAVRCGQVYILQMTGQKVMLDMRRQIFGHLQRLHVGFFDRNPVGRLMTRVTTDVDAVNELFTSGVVTVFGDLFTLLGIMGVMMAMNLKLALVTFSVIPFFFVITNWFRRGSRQSFREVRKWIARINAFLQENLTGMSVVQLFRREQRNREGFAAVNRAHADANVAQIFYYAVFYPAIDILAAVAVALILLYGGGRVLAGPLSLGALVAFVQYSERFWRPISDLSEKFNILQAAMASSERIFTLLDTPAEATAPARPVPLAAVRGRGGFEHVSFAYNPPQWVLRDVDFVVEAGRSGAIVGAAPLIRHRGEGARGDAVRRPEAAPLLRARPRPRPAGADPRRGHLVGRHRDGVAHPGRAQGPAPGPHRHRHRPPALHDPERGRDPGHAQGPHPGAGDAPAAAHAARDLLAALPAPVQGPGARRPRGSRGRPPLIAYNALAGRASWRRPRRGAGR